mgnify:CR=1 FL=1|jgi:hypothetical protein|tara:strand:- start:807 stop:1985 length:1179 start_codon:yes stop_codon:yes gene_type:complete
MSQLNKEKNASNPDQIYFDLQVTNAQSTTQPPPVFSINETRDTPFILVPEDYYLSIVRFSLQTGTLPLFIPHIQPAQGDRNLTSYSVTMEYENAGAAIPLTTQQTFINWIPQDLQASLPSPPSATNNGLQNNQTGYYNCYNYQWFLYQVLQALVTCFATLDATLANYLTVTLGAVHPIITWDTTSNTATLFFDAAWTTSPNPHIKFYMNAPLYQLFSSFVAENQGYTGITLGRNQKIIVADFTGANTQVLPYSPNPTLERIALYQEYSTVSSWSAITSLVFVSNTLPINPSQVSSPLIFSNGQLSSNGTNNSTTLNVITDLIGDDLQYKPYLVYTPNGSNRYISMNGNQPLKNIDISVYYKLKSGELIPYRLGSGATATLKILFARKTNTLG